MEYVRNMEYTLIIIGILIRMFEKKNNKEDKHNKRVKN